MRTSTVLAGPAPIPPARPWWWWLAAGTLVVMAFGAGAVAYMTAQGYPVVAR